MSKISRDVSHDDEYEYEQDLNWRDDGDELGDPSKREYMRGYNLEPYLDRPYASSRRRMRRKGIREVIDVGFTPAELAKMILTRWHVMGGTLQDFFDGVSLRFSNDLKRAVAGELQGMGFTVYPVLVDDRALYAHRCDLMIRRLAKQRFGDRLRACRQMFAADEPVRLCFGELDDYRDIGEKLDVDTVKELVNYYRLIFPEDYAIELTTDLVNDRVHGVDMGRFDDLSISEESLTAIERMLSGNQDPYYPTHDGGIDGWDYITDMRGFDGAAPGKYELAPAGPVVASKKKRSPTR